MDFSQEQKDIFEFAEKGIDNLIVQAVAGAGKTTTLVECVRRIGGNKKILLLAHNKSTRDTLKEKVKDKENVRIYTLHGLGWRLMQEHFNCTPAIDEEKYRKYIIKNLDKLVGEEYKDLSTAKRQNYKSNIFDLVFKARQNLKVSEKEIRKLAKKKYGMSLVADEARVAADVLKWGAENRSTVDYLDLLWFPSEFGYFTKRYLADFIMLDEAQDVSLAQEDVVKRCMKRETRLFAFGDRDQLINSWAGSDEESFDHLKNPDEFRRKAKELPLTTNYRCGKKIIEYARQYTDNNIHAKDDAEDGEVNFNVSLNSVKDGDMVLCRNTAPLMKVYQKGVEQGKKMYFRGREGALDLQRAIDSANGETLDDIILDIKKRIIAIWERLAAETNLDPKEVVGDLSIVSLLDVIDALESFPKIIKTREDIESFISDVFTDETKDGIQLSTIHKAKGLEADNVFIICPSLIPCKYAKLPWQLEEEKHLQYVMCTRPKNSLNFVSEKEIKANVAFLGAKSLYNELLRIRSEVNEKS